MVHNFILIISVFYEKLKFELNTLHKEIKDLT